tara:strand:- start:55 stop:555 length:501 start_codon:yes stop_codon:yes gene_type:complete
MSIAIDDLQIEPVEESQKPLLANLMQAYEHDLSEFTGVGPDQEGIFSVGNYFDVYRTDIERHPFKFLYNGQPAGFALVRQLEDGAYSMAEFFVLRHHRRTGLGKLAAITLFNRFPGIWHVAQDEHNYPAQKFWRSIIAEFTKGDFSEQWSDAQPTGPLQVFQSRGA